MIAPPIPVLLPVLIAALLALMHGRLGRTLAWVLSFLTALIVAGAALSMVVDTRFDQYVYSLGGGPPVEGPSLSLFLVIDSASGMLVLIAAVLTMAAILFSVCYLPDLGARFYAALLMFLAGASGVSLTGDMLNLVVFVEILGLASIALATSNAEEDVPPGAARNLLLIQISSAVLLLLGVAMVCLRAGATNMAQIGRVLAHDSSGIVLISFSLIAGALLIQAAIVPFHFWFAEAVTLGPAPVSALFAGVLVETGLYAAARVYWAVYSGALATHQNDLRNMLVIFGAVTALVGAVMCFADRHLKRILAFATVSQMGIVLLGIALLTPEAMAGGIIFVMGFSVLIGGLYLATGILLYRTGTYDEIELTARPRHLRWTGAVFFAAAAGLAGLPPFGTFWGEMMLDGSAYRLGYVWVPWVAFAAAVLTSGAVFRFSGRAFFRWGPPVEEFAETSRPSDHLRIKSHHHTPASMFLPAAALLVLGAMAGMAPRLTGAAEAAAIHVQDRASYAQRILDLQTPYPPTVHDQPATGGDVARGLGAVLAAILLAAMTLLSAEARRTVGESPIAQLVVSALRTVHAGPVAAQVAWALAGVMVLIVSLFVFMR